MPARTPQDRLAKSAVAAEATGQDLSVEFGGETYAVPSTMDWSLDALEAYESGKATAFLQHLLGEEQYAVLKATKPKVRDVNAFVSEIQRVAGLSGN